MIFNVGAGGATDADKIKYGESNVGATLDNLNESVNNLDNSVAELNESVDELNNSLDWKYLGSKKGNADITLPNSFNELYVEVVNGYMNWIYVFNLPYATLTNDKKYYFNGFWLNDTSNGMAQVGCSKTQINLPASYRNKNDETSNSTITVYYR